MTGRSPARLLAPIALVTSFIALYVVVTSGDSETETDATTKSSQTETTKRTKTTKKGSSKQSGKTYTVKAGDTPSGIAAKLDISVETLLELNPKVDPQLLSPGQRLKISP